MSTASAPARCVFKCFKCLERAADRVTGAAGPVFITLGIVLIGTATICFFDVIEPTLPLRLLLTPICVLIAVNMFAHYFYACTVPPGFIDGPKSQNGWRRSGPETVVEGSGWLWAKKRRDGYSLGNMDELTPAVVSICKRCGGRKPERTHHCRICNRCVLKYDHHCPWINQCVGLYNERHFVLFMAYLSIATWAFMITGFPKAWESIGLTNVRWSHRSPVVAFILSYILAVAIGIAITIMCTWHIWGIAVGETSVENQDFQLYRKVAKERGEVFINAYDLGPRRNLELFFNVGETGYPLYTLLLPLRTLPYTDGRSWARKHGSGVHLGLRPGEELVTDDDSE